MPKKSPIMLFAIRPNSFFFLKSHVKSLVNIRSLGFATSMRSAFHQGTRPFYFPAADICWSRASSLISSFAAASLTESSPDFIRSK